jgi:hypothetical protein
MWIPAERPSVRCRSALQGPRRLGCSGAREVPPRKWRRDLRLQALAGTLQRSDRRCRNGWNGAGLIGNATDNGRHRGGCSAATFPASGHPACDTRSDLYPSAASIDQVAGPTRLVGTNRPALSGATATPREVAVRHRRLQSFFRPLVSTEHAIGWLLRQS